MHELQEMTPKLYKHFILPELQDGVVSYGVVKGMENLSIRLGFDGLSALNMYLIEHDIILSGGSLLDVAMGDSTQRPLDIMLINMSKADLNVGEQIALDKVPYYLLGCVELGITLGYHKLGDKCDVIILDLKERRSNHRRLIFMLISIIHQRMIYMNHILLLVLRLLLKVKLLF